MKFTRIKGNAAQVHQYTEGIRRELAIPLVVRDKQGYEKSTLSNLARNTRLFSDYSENKRELGINIKPRVLEYLSPKDKDMSAGLMSMASTHAVLPDSLTPFQMERISQLVNYLR